MLAQLLRHYISSSCRRSTCAMMLLQGVLLLLAVEGLLVSSGSIEKAFERNQIVPYVVPTAPHCLIHIIYPNGLEVNKGNKLTPFLVKDKPSVSYSADPDKFYTLAMVDPDVPSRCNQEDGEFLHWLVVNICGNDVASGEDLAAYGGSAPAKGTGYHRYVFLAYQQPGFLYFDEPRVSNLSEAHRPKFSINDFSKKYHYGYPVAGNFYYAKYDKYVDVRIKQLRGE